MEDVDDSSSYDSDGIIFARIIIKVFILCPSSIIIIIYILH